MASVFLVLSAISVVGASGLDEGDMEIIWTESDGLRQEIYTSTYRSGGWQEPEQITDDNADNLHPSIDVGTDGTKWAVWTAIENTGFEIRYSVYRDGAWSEVKKIPGNLASNIKPSIIIDKDNVPWVAWSGNNGDDDDIYYTRFIDGNWLEEQRLHEENNVPDILVFLDTDDEDRPVASWSRFQDGAYVEVVSVWDENSWSEPVLVEPNKDDGSVEDETREIIIPEFIQDTRQVFLRAIQ